MSAERGTCSSPELIIAIIDDRTENSDQRVLEVFPLVSSYLVIAAVLGENAASVRVKLVSCMLPVPVTHGSYLQTSSEARQGL